MKKIRLLGWKNNDDSEMETDELEENEETDLKYWRNMIYNLEFDTKNINQLWRWD